MGDTTFSSIHTSMLMAVKAAVNHQTYFSYLLLGFLSYKVLVPKGHYFQKEKENCEGLECYRQCLSYQFSLYPKRKFWYKFHHMLRACNGAADFPPIIDYPNLDDMKHAVLPVAISRNDECNIITLGIGHDVVSERKMKLHFPEWCRFSGADPSSQINKALYEGFGGTYHEVAVGHATRLQEARVYGETVYENMIVRHVELSEFLLRYVNVRKIVDVLLIDIEGGEFELMPLLRKNGRVEQKNITICQYNVEFHWPTATQTQQFAKYLIDSVNENRFLPLKPMKYWKVARLYALNVADEICVQRYLSRD